MLGSLPNLSSVDSVHSYSKSQPLMVMTTPAHGNSWPSSLKLNPITYDHIRTIADDVLACSWTWFPSTTVLPSLSISPAMTSYFDSIYHGLSGDLLHRLQRHYWLSSSHSDPHTVVMQHLRSYTEFIFLLRKACYL